MNLINKTQNYILNYKNMNKIIYNYKNHWGFNVVNNKINNNNLIVTNNIYINNDFKEGALEAYKIVYSDYLNKIDFTKSIYLNRNLSIALNKIVSKIDKKNLNYIVNLEEVKKKRC